MDNRLVCICGPTASGKTALSVALAKKLHTEIISADSMQLYRYMDIGTAKPTIEERQDIRHHLFDVCEPGEGFSVARYVELADAAAQDILSRNMIPVVVGGTGLYMDALIECSTFRATRPISLFEKNTKSWLVNRGTKQCTPALQRSTRKAQNDCIRII